jgi:hypothetical protein
VLFHVGRLDEKQAEHGMTAVGAMLLAGHLRAVIFFHFPKSRIGLVHQEFVTAEERVDIHA